MKSPSHVLLAVPVAVLAFALTACGGADKNAANASRDEPGDLVATPAAQVTSTPPTDAVVVKVTLDGSKVTPTKEQLALNQKVVLEIHAKDAGQLHIHSTPQHSIDFPAGDSQITISFDKPGAIDMEDHALGTLITQFEVS